MTEVNKKLEEGQVKEVHILQQMKVKFADLKRGTIFRLVTSGPGGVGELTSDWQVALTDVQNEEGHLSLKSDKVTIMTGIPNIVDIAVVKSEMPKESPDAT